MSGGWGRVPATSECCRWHLCALLCTTMCTHLGQCVSLCSTKHRVVTARLLVIKNRFLNYSFHNWRVSDEEFGSFTGALMEPRTWEETLELLHSSASKIYIWLGIVWNSVNFSLIYYLHYYDRIVKYSTPRERDEARLSEVIVKLWPPRYKAKFGIYFVFHLLAIVWKIVHQCIVIQNRY